MSESVTVNATDWGGGYDFDGGLPFSATPDWLLAAIEAGKMMPIDGGETDYAEWSVLTPLGIAVARPDDTIWSDGNGGIWVRPAPIHPETGED